MPTVVGVDPAQVDAALRAPRRRPRRRGAGTRTVIVSKNASCTSSSAAAPQALGEDRGEAVHAARDRLEARRARGRRRTSTAITASSTCAVQMLRGRLLAADVLLAGLQREAVAPGAPSASTRRRRGGRAAARSSPSRTAM